MSSKPTGNESGPGSSRSSDSAARGAPRNEEAVAAPRTGEAVDDDVIVEPVRRLPTDEQPTVISGRAAVAADGPFAWAPPRELGPRLVGQTLGHFQLDAFVGGGGMGAVFRAHDLSLDRTVAVKVLSPQQLGDSLKRFRNEAQSAARLNHPNIARVYYVGEDEGWNYIVFEYIEGINVRDLVARDGPLPLADAISYTLQVADALDHAFRRDVIHRDIKPSNILITREGEAKLVDMGLARLHRVGASREDLTESGITLGTFDYISPEQARDPRNTDVRSDLYSLGCTLYYMLTGRPPFPDGTVLQKLLSHSSDPPPDPRQFRPDLPHGVMVVLSRLLAKRPEQRYQTPGELMAALLAAAERHGLALAPADRNRWLPAPAPARRMLPRWVPWSVAAATLLLLALGMEFFTSPPARTGPLPPLLGANYEDRSPSPSVTEPPSSSPPMPASRRGSAADEPDTSAVPSDTAPPDTVRSEGESNDADNAARPVPAATDDSGKPPQAGSADDGAGQVADGTVEATASEADERPALIDSATRRVIRRRRDAPSAPSPAQQLRTALQALMADDQIEEIVLDLDGIIDLVPPQSDWVLPAGRDAVLRAAPGRQVTVRVRPARLEAVTGDHPAMIPLGEGRWSFESVHWRFELPETIPERRGWSLFGLTATSEVEFQRCSITMVNHDARGNVGHPGVSAFRLGTVQADLMPPGEEPVAAPGGGPQIWLEDSFVRGEGNLLSVVEAQPLLCYWKHGVLAVTGRLIDITGATRDMEWQQGRIECSLEEVILFAGQGLVRTRQGDMQQFLPDIALSCKRCIVATAAADPAPAVMEQRGVDAETWHAPQVSGQQNRYRNTDTLLRVFMRDGAGEPTEYSISDLRLRPQPWYQEIDAGPLARFPWRFETRARSSWTMAEFIDEETQRRLLEVLGWDVESLAGFARPPAVPPSSDWKEPTTPPRQPR